MEMVIDVRYATGLRTMRLQAHVVRVAPEGIGVEWNEFAPEIVSALERMLEPAPAAPEANQEGERQRPKMARRTTSN
jgi:hypothetical protein